MLHDGRMDLSLKLKIQQGNIIDGELFLFLHWAFDGFGLFLDYLPFHPKSIHNDLCPFSGMHSALKLDHQWAYQTL